MKKCRVCEEEKPRSSQYFFRAKANKDGYENLCKECKRKGYNRFEDMEGYEPAPKYIWVECMNKQDGCNSDKFQVLVPHDFNGRMRKQCHDCNMNGHPHTRDNFGTADLNKHLTGKLREMGDRSQQSMWGFTTEEG